MKVIFQLVIPLMLAFSLMACGDNDPGPLAGTWKLEGPLPMTVHFRKGESEAMGMIEKVSYEVNGNQVLVTSENGPMEGVTVRYVIAGPNTVKSSFGMLTRIN